MLNTPWHRVWRAKVMELVEAENEDVHLFIPADWFEEAE